MKIEDLYEDIKDGTKLLVLLQILSGERLVSEYYFKTILKKRLNNLDVKTTYVFSFIKNSLNTY